MQDVSLLPGQRVKHWREIRGLTQVELADRAEMDNSKLCRIERGETEARAKDIEQLAAALDLSMPEFYGAEEKAS
jgi:transcriptional regulator with XRE-family HTH domain